MTIVQRPLIEWAPHAPRSSAQGQRAQEVFGKTRIPERPRTRKVVSKRKAEEGCCRWSREGSQGSCTGDRVGISGVLWFPSRAIPKVPSRTHGLDSCPRLQTAKMEQQVWRTSRPSETCLRDVSPPGKCILGIGHVSVGTGHTSRSQSVSRSRASPPEFLWLVSTGNGRGSIEIETTLSSRSARWPRATTSICLFASSETVHLILPSPMVQFTPYKPMFRPTKLSRRAPPNAPHLSPPQLQGHIWSDVL